MRISKYGLWENPYEDVIVPSNRITMQYAPAALATTDTGYQEIMAPGLEYDFPGNYVIEQPLNKPKIFDQNFTSVKKMNNFVAEPVEKFSKLKEKGMSKNLNKNSLQGVSSEEYIQDKRNTLLDKIKNNNQAAIIADTYSEMFSNPTKAQEGKEVIYVNNEPYYVDKTYTPWWSNKQTTIIKNDKGEKRKLRPEVYETIKQGDSPYVPVYYGWIGGRANIADNPNWLSGRMPENRKDSSWYSRDFEEGLPVDIMSTKPYEEDFAVYEPGSYVGAYDKEGDFHLYEVTDPFVASRDLFRGNATQGEGRTRYLAGIGPRLKEVGERSGEYAGDLAQDFETAKRTNRIGVPLSGGINSQIVAPYVNDDGYFDITTKDLMQTPVIRPKKIVEPEKHVVDEEKQEESKETKDNQPKDSVVVTSVKPKQQAKKEIKQRERKKWKQSGGQETPWYNGEAGNFPYRLQKTEYNVPTLGDRFTIKATENGRTRRFMLTPEEYASTLNDEGYIDVDKMNDILSQNRKLLRNQKKGYFKDVNFDIDNETNQAGLYKGDEFITDKIKTNRENYFYPYADTFINALPVAANIYSQLQRRTPNPYDAENIFSTIYGNDYGSFLSNSGLMDPYRI